MFQKLAIANIKGGVGKTTTAVNLAAALVEIRQRVLCIDLDPQASLSTWLGFDLQKLPGTVCDVFTETARPVDSLILPTREGYDLVPANFSLVKVATELEKSPSDITLLRTGLDALDGRYDYVLLDCPASTGVLTGVGLAAADQVIIPLTADFLTFRSLKLLLAMLREIQKTINPNVRVGGIFYTMYESKMHHARMIDGIARGTYGARIPFFASTIRYAETFKEAAAAYQSALRFAPNSPAAEAYRALAHEIHHGLTQTPENTVYLALAQGKQLLTRGDRQGAFTAFSYASKADPSCLEAWQGRAEAAPDWEEAVRSLARALALKPDHAETNAELGNRLQEGIAGTTAEKLPQLLNLAHHLSELGQWEHAEKLYRRVLEIDLVNEEGWLGLARITEDVGDALMYVSRAQELDPTSTRAKAVAEVISERVKAVVAAWLEDANENEREGKKVEAHKLYRKAADIDPANDAAWLGCAKTAAEFDLGVQYVRYALKANPQNSEARELYQLLSKPKEEEKDVKPPAPQRRSLAPFLLIIIVLIFIVAGWYVAYTR